MKKVLMMCSLLAAFSASAQPNSVVPKNIRASNTLDNLFDADGLSISDNLYGIPLEPGRLVGTTYLSDEWKRTTIMMYDTDKMIEGYDVRYEVSLDQLEIRTNDGVKVLSGKRVKSFVWADSLSKIPHYYVNAKDYKEEGGSPQVGFFEVLAEGPLTLLSRTHIVVREPDYDQRLDVGQRDTRLLRKTTFFYLEDKVLKPLPTSRKKLLPVFGDHADEAEQFIKVNKLSLNEAWHLRALFEDYNSRILTN